MSAHLTIMGIKSLMAYYNHIHVVYGLRVALGCLQGLVKMSALGNLAEK